jgi:hypothetical protein
VKCFVTFRLKPGVTVEEYFEWFHRENVPAVSKVASIKTYQVWRVTSAMEGDPPQFVEAMEIDDQAQFERELEEVPEMAAMLEGWYSRVAEQVVFYGEEVKLD